METDILVVEFLEERYDLLNTEYCELQKALLSKMEHMKMLEKLIQVARGEK